MEEHMVKAGTPEWWGNLVTYLVLSVCLGILGIDRFYKGEAGWGVLKLISVGGLGIWYLVDICIFAYRLGTTGQWAKASPQS
jgi:TM2 domain-containing membrane protein YozV